MRTKSWFGVLAACCIVVGGTAVSVNAQNAAPCEQDARHRALDFWLGEWQVIDAEGRPVGTNRIEKRQGGCLIEERWSAAGGGGGQSMNYFDPADGVWKQHWVDQRGTVVEYQGGVEDGALRYTGRHVRHDGKVTMARVVLEPVGGGRLRHLIEHSTDGGDNWSVYFDGTYVPAGEGVQAAAEPAVGASAKESAAAPSPMSRPTPAEPVAQAPEEAPAQPQAARQVVQEGSDVKAVTRELQREEIPETQAPELVMASPMVLEVTPGTLVDYPENAAWSTDDTAGFICDEVTLREVGVSYRLKKRGRQLVVDSTVFTHRRLKKVDLLVELFDGSELVASVDLPRIRIGLNIPAHGEEGLVVPAEMEMTEERFRQLFSEGADTLLRFTMNCPSTS